LRWHSTQACHGEKSAKLNNWCRSTKMTYAALGTNTSAVEVTHISKHGFWILVRDEELFLPFSEFPWFREVAVGKILHVELPSANHLYWPDLDVDLSVESIRHPEHFPLVSQTSA
jgi:hypothetical protein